MKTTIAMISTDRDGLSRSQISRIDRLQMTRYRSSNKKYGRNKMAAFIATLICLAIPIFIIGSALIQKHEKLDTKLTTSLASLDDQTPSITIYAEENR